MTGVFMLMFAGTTFPQGPKDGRPSEKEKAFSKLKSWKIGKKYRNYKDFKMTGEGSYWEMTKEYFSSKTIKEPKEKLDFQRVRPGQLFSGNDTSFQITWMGHSTSALELDGLKVLLDPVFSNNTSPMPWLYSVRRFQKDVPIAANQLPEVDVVIISHDHYDHLDKNTIIAIESKVKRFIVPIGLKRYLLKWAVPSDKITELDWSQSIKIGQHTIVALPAQHFSGRGLWGWGKTLWASWAILGPKHKVFYSGDTGYHQNTFKKIGEKYGPFNLVLLDSGQYSKHWPYVHMFPEEAVQAHLDLTGDVYIPIHWGAFNLSLHNWFEPIERAIRAAEEHSVRMAIPFPGQTFNLKGRLPDNRWWQKEED